ncbi:MYOSIN-11 [Salix purpurea]|uniref:MYOSIN-11 n=1 Tax=Salix purpurea TaxID=77065 RepID=A0A9Q1ADI1_SALPP|nr:MYOSIN-11 [Salix purpurea]
MTAKNEDEILNEILGNDRMESSSSGQQSNTDMFSSIQRASSRASYSNTQQVDALDGGGEICRSHSVDECNHVYSEVGSTTPEELRQRALDEKNRYKILKAEGKSEEALKAFKRGKELERQVDALELSIRKKCRNVLSSSYTVEIQNEDGPKESVRKSKRLAQVNEKDNFTAELRELGLSDMDLHDRGKKLVKMSLEGELSSLLGESSGRTNKDMGRSGIDKTQVFELKRKAVALKREGKIVEAKEELKKAKVLEQKLEEQELLGVNEDSDDEISALISSMDSDQEDILFAEDEQGHGFDFDHLVGTADDLHVDGNFEVTDEDLVDPELAATLKSLGWTDDSDKAIVHLKKAKLLERDLESLGGEVGSSIVHDTTRMTKSSPSQNTIAKSNALALRREGRLNAAEEELKKGKVLEQQLEEMDNASNVKGKQASVGSENPDLENEDPTITGSPPIREGGEDVTEQDIHDPAYLSLLRSFRGSAYSSKSFGDPDCREGSGYNKPKDEIVRPINSAAEEGDVNDIAEKDMHDSSLLSMRTNLGWKDDGVEAVTVQPKPSKQVLDHLVHSTDPSIILLSFSISAARPRSKGEIPRELLGLKRKALSLRCNGETEKAEELLKMAKSSGSLNNHEKLNNVNNAVEMIEKLAAAAAVDPNEKVIESFTGSGRKGSDKTAPPSWSPDIVNQVPFEINEDNHPYVGDFDLLGEMGSLSNSRVNQGTEFFPPPHQSMNLMDLLTDSSQGLASQNSKNALQQEAKQLEKSLEAETLEPVSGTHDGSTSVSNAPPVQQKDPGAPKFSPKPLSGRDRFKLQQESLSHKHLALKLRREGQVEEAEAEFELAKALEAHLDEMSSNDSGKSSVNIAEPVDVVVEDLLDPQLLSALKASGIENTSILSQSSERPGPAKVSATKSEKNSQERTQFIEQIKAVNLKRAGKQAEALDALRRAKLYEKKLNSL